MADGRPDPERDGVTSPVDLLEGGTGPGRWRRRWTALPRIARWLIAALVVLLLTGAGVVRLVEQQRALQVELAASLGVWSDSTSPPGGQVSFYVVVRNDGDRPLSVTSVAGGGDGLDLRMRYRGDREVPAGVGIEIPLSVRLTCGTGVSDPRGSLTVDLAVRREDGGATTRQVALEPAALVLDVAATLCGVRPDLRSHELSGPVLRAAPAPESTGECEHGAQGGRIP